MERLQVAGNDTLTILSQQMGGRREPRGPWLEQGETARCCWINLTRRIHPLAGESFVRCHRAAATLPVPIPQLVAVPDRS